MAKRPDSEAIAQGPCITGGCDQTMLVFKTKRRGHYLMGRCPECKSIQGTGKAVQAALQAVVDGKAPPSETVTEPAQPTKKAAPETVKPTTEQPDYDPGEVVADDQPQTAKQGGGGGLVILGLTVLGAVFALSLGGN